MKKELIFDDFGVKTLRDMAKGEQIVVKNVPLPKLVSVQSQLSRFKRITDGFNYRSIATSTIEGFCDLLIIVL